MVKVYSHPRSGTNYLCALLAANFYPGQDLSKRAGVVGHWANRAQVRPTPHGKLFGGHGLPRRYKLSPSDIYVFRDGRDVALSLWRSKHFKHPSWENLSFSEYIRELLDWVNSPGDKYDSGLTIFQHWKNHLELWSGAVTMVRYENAVRHPEQVVRRLSKLTGIPLQGKLRTVDDLVGWFPSSSDSGSVIGGWRDVMSGDDLDLYYRLVGKGFWGSFEE